MSRTTEDLRRGIEAYAPEQARLLRLLRLKGGEFSASDFDRWFQHPRRVVIRRKARCYQPHTLILGYSDGSFSEWGLHLEVLQALAQLGQVATVRNEGELFYRLVAAED